MYKLAWLLLLATPFLPIAACSAQKQCTEHNITVNATSENFKYILDPINSNNYLADILFQAGRRDSNTTFKPVAPPTQAETSVYTLSGTFCEPVQGGAETVLLASHGGGFDRTYVRQQQLLMTKKLTL